MFHEFDSDIGLIKLPSPVELTDVIQPVHLGCTSNNNVDAVAIGNGLMHTKDKDLAPILQYAQLKTVSLLQCLPFFPIIAFRKSVICVKGLERQSVCNGDSGGPLIEANSKNLIGVTSFGSAFGCELGMPQGKKKFKIKVVEILLQLTNHHIFTGFTRISSYLPWIEEVTGIGCKK